MKKLVRILDEISDHGPDVRFEFHIQGIVESHWKASVELNHTALLRRKDFDKVRQIPGLDELYVMEELSENPQRAIDNIAMRLKKVLKHLERHDQ